MADKLNKEYNIQAPPLRTIGNILKKNNLTKPNKKNKNKGAAKYLNYPEKLIYEYFFKRVLEIDFITKNLRHQTKPLVFLSFSFKKEPKLHHFTMVSSQRKEELISGCNYFFKTFEIPNAIKVDNCSSSIGSSLNKRTISPFIQFC